MSRNRNRIFHLEGLEDRRVPSSLSTFPDHFTFENIPGHYQVVHIKPDGTSQVRGTEHPPEAFVVIYPPGATV